MIPNKKITEDEFHDLITWRKLTYGGEAIICESDNPYSLYKIFTNLDKPKPMGEFKEKKIELLHELKPDFSIQPISTISLNDVIIGYEMTTDFGLESYKPYQLSPEELKYFLTKTKDILEYFSSLGIIYGDLEPRNILFDRQTGDIRFCDMDKLPFNLQFYEAHRPVDSSAHPFMHNIMTLRATGLDLYWANRFDIRKNFKRPAVKIIQSMSKPKEFKEEYIVQYMKKLK